MLDTLVGPGHIIAKKDFIWMGNSDVMETHRGEKGARMLGWRQRGLIMCKLVRESLTEKAT